jgi:hypothetical protein
VRRGGEGATKPLPFGKTIRFAPQEYRSKEEGIDRTDHTGLKGKPKARRTTGYRARDPQSAPMGAGQEPCLQTVMRLGSARTGELAKRFTDVRTVSLEVSR